MALVSIMVTRDIPVISWWILVITYQIMCLVVCRCAMALIFQYTIADIWYQAFLPWNISRFFSGNILAFNHTTFSFFKNLSVLWHKYIYFFLSVNLTFYSAVQISFRHVDASTVVIQSLFSFHEAFTSK